MHPFLLLVCFNAFSSTAHPWILTATSIWGTILTYLGPLFIAMEGLSSLLVAQKLGEQAKALVEEGEVYQFILLIASAISYVGSAWWIVMVRLSSLSVAVLKMVFVSRTQLQQPPRSPRHSWAWLSRRFYSSPSLGSSYDARTL